MPVLLLLLIVVLASLLFDRRTVGLRVVVAIGLIAIMFRSGVGPDVPPLAWWLMALAVVEIAALWIVRANKGFWITGARNRSGPAEPGRSHSNSP